MTTYFVIDTDKYAGNFERQLCAWVTGIAGECGVGDMIAVAACESKNAPDLHSLISTEADDHGTQRPCKVYPTPGYYNNGLGFEWQDGQEAEALAEWVKFCKKESLKYTGNYQEAMWQEKAELKAAHKYPAYLSVAIICGRRPTDDEISLMKTRAEDFVRAAVDGAAEEICGYRSAPKFNITGFRIVTTTLVTNEEAV